MVSYLITMFLGKHPVGSLPALSAHSLASNRQLALLESAEEGNYFSTKECAGREDQSQESSLQSGHATDQATAPCELQGKQVVFPLILQALSQQYCYLVWQIPHQVLSTKCFF